MWWSNDDSASSNDQISDVARIHYDINCSIGDNGNINRKLKLLIFSDYASALASAYLLFKDSDAAYAATLLGQLVMCTYWWCCELNTYVDGIGDLLHSSMILMVLSVSPACRKYHDHDHDANDFCTEWIWNLADHAKQLLQFAFDHPVRGHQQISSKLIKIP